MYSVIKTGGKQYRVSPGDLLVVEKLDGEPGAAVAFGDVLMLGDGEAVTVGAPTVDGASVAATLVETRKGEKIKIFKKTRRQGYRRTRGHRQPESVLRVTAIDGGKGGKSAKWDGKVDLTTKAEAKTEAKAAPAPKAEAKPKAAAPKAEAKAKTEAKPAKAAAAPKAKTESKAAAPKKPAAKKDK